MLFREVQETPEYKRAITRLLKNYTEQLLTSKVKPKQKKKALSRHQRKLNQKGIDRTTQYMRIKDEQEDTVFEPQE